MHTSCSMWLYSPSVFSLIITRSKSLCLQNRITWLRMNVFHLSPFEHLYFNIPITSLILSFFLKLQLYIVIYCLLINTYLFLEYTVQILYMNCTCWVVISFDVMSTTGIHIQRQSRVQVGQNCNNKTKSTEEQYCESCDNFKIGYFGYVLCSTKGWGKWLRVKSPIPHWDSWYGFTSYNIGK